MNNFYPKFNQNMRNLSYHKVKNWYAGLAKPRQRKPPLSHIVQIGDPVLRAPTNDVPVGEVQSERIQEVIDTMKRVFHSYDCVGLAAPQIGTPLRIILVGINKKTVKSYTKDELTFKEIELHPLTLVINPVVNITDYAKVIQPESCESVKGFWADVTRYRALEIKGLDENGNNVAFAAKGWLARIIQHEMDHLNGKMYTDLMDRKTLTCGCWQVINEQNGKVNLPYGPV